MDISTLSNYFELYGGMAIFLVVLLEYMIFRDFRQGLLSAACRNLCSTRRVKSVPGDCDFSFSRRSWELDLVFSGNVRWKCFYEYVSEKVSKTQASG